MTVRINGVKVAVGSDEPIELAAARELLRQRAVEADFLDDEVSDADEVSEAIEALLAHEVVTPTPAEVECRRYYDAHPREFISGDLVHARHILFQVTPTVPVPEIRSRAEQTLNELLREPSRFDALARELSNCPSGQHGGNLGQISRGDMVPEFERAVFRPGPTGMLRDVVKTRFGFHVVSVDRRIAGKKLPFEAVQEKIAERLSAAVVEKAIRQYVSVLAARAELVGVDLDAAVTPLVQ